MPELSICIPVKNRSRVEVDGHVLSLLPNCIRALASIYRLGDDWQIVVADWSSDDLPLSGWIDNMADPIPVKMVTMPEPFCCGRGLNKAAELADAPNLLFLATDMVMDRPTMDAGMRHLAVGEAYVPLPMLAMDPEHKTLAFGELAVGTTFITKALFEKAGPFPEFHSHGLCDTVWTARADAEKIPIRVEASPGLLHQWHPYDADWMNRYYDNWQKDNDEKLAAWKAGKFKGSDRWPM